VFLSFDWSAPKARPPSLWVTPLRRRRKILIAPLPVKVGGVFFFKRATAPHLTAAISGG